MMKAVTLNANVIWKVDSLSAVGRSKRLFRSQYSIVSSQPRVCAPGREADLLPLTVVVLDVGGHTIALKREDGSGIARVEIATGKAAGALGVGMAGRTLKERFGARTGVLAAVASATNGRFIAAPGGVLILNENGQGIGAVGVSGDASDKDEYAAIVGVKAAGLVPEPSTAAEGWQDAPL